MKKKGIATAPASRSEAAGGQTPEGANPAAWGKGADLRQRAEARLKKQVIHPRTLAADDPLRLVHELLVHQVELEMQNEELQRAHDEAAAELERYTGLYDFAPAGYFTLARDGTMILLNLQAAGLLGASRAELDGRRFGLINSPDTLPVFNRYLGAVFLSREKQVCEVCLLSGDGVTQRVRLEGRAAASGEECRLVAVEISQGGPGKDRPAAGEIKIQEAPENLYNRFRTMVDNTYDWETWMGEDGAYLYCSPSCRRISGYEVEDFMDHPGLLDEIIHPDDLPVWQKHFEAEPSNKTGEQIEFRIRCKDGSTGWIGHVCQAVYDREGHYAGVRGSNRDINAQKQAEAALKESRERLRSVLENSLEAAYRRNLQTGQYEYLSPAIERITGWTAAEKMQADQDPNRDLVHADDRAEAQRTIRRAMAECRSRGRATGEMEVRCLCKGGQYRWVAERFTITADGAGQPLYRDGSISDISERKGVEQALRDSQQFNQEIIMGAGEGIYAYDRQLKIVLWNPFMEKMSGLTADEVLGQPALELFPFIKEQGRDRLLEQALAGEVVTSPDLPYHVAETGQSGWRSSTYAPHRDAGGQIIGIIGMVRDISERIAVEEALRNSENKFSILFNKASLPTVLSSLPDLAIVDVNEAWTALLGYDREAVIGKTAPELGINRDPVRRARMIEEIGQLAPVRDLEQVLYSRSGEAHIVSTSIDLVRIDGEVYALSSIKDITERKQMEEALQKSEQRYRLIVDTAQEGICLLDPEGKLTYANQCLAAMLGYTLDETMEQSFMTFIDGHHQNEARAYWERHLQGISEQYDFRLRRKDGSDLWVMVSGSPIRGEDGRAMGLLVMITDITGRKLAELDLKVSYKKLDLLFDILPVGISILDHNYNTIKFNHALKEILAVSDKELLSGEYRQRRYFRVDGSIKPPEEFPSARIVNGESKILNVETGVEIENGDRVWTNVSAVAGPFEDWNAIIVTTDITARKRAEEETRRQAARAEALVQTAARLNEQLDLESLLHSVCQEAAAALQAPAAWISLYDAERDVLCYAADAGMPPGFKDLHQPVPRKRYEAMTGQKGALVVNPHRQKLAGKHNQDMYIAINATSTALASMVHDGLLIGTISIVSFEAGRSFSADDLSLLQGLADQAALAIANSRLFDEVKAGRAQLSALSLALMDAAENERRALAMELHEEMGQVLNRIKLSLDMAPRLGEVEGQKQYVLVSSLVGDLIQRIRRISLELRPGMLDDLGLLPTLQWLITTYNEKNGWQVQFKSDRLAQRFPARLEIAAYRIVQEALTNISRHTADKNPVVEARADGTALHIRISDQGGGFDVQAALDRRNSSGLSGMGERARQLGGELKIESTPGQGTCISVRLPI